MGACLKCFPDTWCWKMITRTCRRTFQVVLPSLLGRKGFPASCREGRYEGGVCVALSLRKLEKCFWGVKCFWGGKGFWGGGWGGGVECCGGGGTNRSDIGLNLSGSWQQGHSATYNTPSRI